MDKKFKVLLTAKAFGMFSDEPLKKLEDAGCEIVRSPFKLPIQPGELATVIKGMDAVIVQNDVVDKAAFDAADRLKVVVMHGIGLDQIDLAYAKQKGIYVTNLPGVNADTVAELALGFILSLLRRTEEAEKAFREGHWKMFIGEEVEGKKLGIIGLGAIGKALATKAIALGMNVVANNRSKDLEFTEKMGIRYVSIDEMLPTCDFISLNTPISKETYHIIDRDRLYKMKKGAFLVNVSRGGLVDEEALYDALKEGHLAGAALDVYETEPLPKDSKLFELPTCILTPHIGGQTKQALMRSSMTAANKVLEALQK